ncbi:MAG: HAD family hydrolase [Anaerobutyricum soehngenii]
MNYAMTQCGYPEHTLDEVRRYVGNGILLLMQRAIPGGKDDPNFDKAFTSFWGTLRESTVTILTKPYAGIMELLHTLKENNIKIAIVSNKADFAVKELNAIYFKDLILVAIGEKESEGIRKKPAPDTVIEALKQLGSTAENSVYIGDSDVDIETARNSGMDEILCDWGFRGEEFLKQHGAKIIIKKPDEILSLIGIE